MARVSLTSKCREQTSTDSKFAAPTCSKFAAPHAKYYRTLVYILSKEGGHRYDRCPQNDAMCFIQIAKGLSRNLLDLFGRHMARARKVRFRRLLTNIKVFYKVLTHFLDVISKHCVSLYPPLRGRVGRIAKVAFKPLQPVRLRSQAASRQFPL